MKVEVEVDEGVKRFLEMYAASKGGTLDEFLRNLVASHARRLVEDMPVEERAQFLGVERLFRQ